ncbi:hypothetical protein CBL_13896 [Carabus blaptoides fortunei]
MFNAGLVHMIDRIEKLSANILYRNEGAHKHIVRTYRIASPSTPFAMKYGRRLIQSNRRSCVSALNSQQTAMQKWKHGNSKHIAPETALVNIISKIPHTTRRATEDRPNRGTAWPAN